MRLKHLIFAFLFLVSIDCLASDNAAPGFLEGELKILAFREVELAEGTPSKFSGGNYGAYPLIILTRNGNKEVTRVTADESGNYRIALPPGDYVLDVQNRKRRHVRATPQPFTVVSNQTVHVDMNIDAGVR
jgi:Carboxypeptidase regulatory-like domain